MNLKKYIAIFIAGNRPLHFHSFYGDFLKYNNRILFLSHFQNHNKFQTVILVSLLYLLIEHL
jgi:hypothetical protein